jgi:hypothetical protein
MNLLKKMKFFCSEILASSRLLAPKEQKQLKQIASRTRPKTSLDMVVDWKYKTNNAEQTDPVQNCERAIRVVKEIAEARDQLQP